MKRISFTWCWLEQPTFPREKVIRVSPVRTRGFRRIVSEISLHPIDRVEKPLNMGVDINGRQPDEFSLQLHESADENQLSPPAAQ
jgi:hypothetical protein